MSEFLTQRALQNIQRHKYNAEGKTLLQPIFEPFWERMVRLVPPWVAPNAITLTGLMFNVVATILCIMYSPDCKTELPIWLFYFSSFALYAYSTLDAIDGKQARRTKSSSPLGELFDHGCDSLSCAAIHSTGLTCIMLCAALQLGDRIDALCIMAHLSMFLYYLAHWQTYCSGKLKFYTVDVVEANLLSVITCLLCGLFGPNFFTVHLFGILQLRWILYFGVLAGFVVYSFNSCYVIFIEGGIGRNHSTVANSSVLSPAGPVILVFMLSYFIITTSEIGIFAKEPMIYLLFMTIVASKITNKLIVAHMTKTEIFQLDPIMISMIIFLVNWYFGYPVNERIVLYVATCYAFFDLCKYCVSICRQICDFLGIYVFSITAAPPVATPPIKSSATNKNR